MKKKVGKSRLSQSWGIIKSQNGFFRGIKRLKNVVCEIWLFDWKRPGIHTGFQTTSEVMPSEYMWYSPTETTVCFEILGFTKEWIRSYFEYSTKDTVLAFVDFGAGAGKTNQYYRSRIGVSIKYCF